MILATDILKTIIVIGILDFIWLSSTGSIYKKNYQAVQGSNKPIVIRWTPAIVSYALMMLGFLLFVLPIIRDKKTPRSVVIFKGALFGLVVYGIYNATCMAVFKDFPLGIAILDTAWGMTIYALTTLVFVYWDQKSW